MIAFPQRELTWIPNEASDEVVGVGPIEFLLKDPDVTEVMVNGADDVFVERKGRIEWMGDGTAEGGLSRPSASRSPRGSPNIRGDYQNGRSSAA
jgi:hypothetical protein